MSKQRVRIYTAEDVSQHCTYSDCWLSYHGKVYDVTRFKGMHPGGTSVFYEEDIGTYHFFIIPLCARPPPPLPATRERALLTCIVYSWPGRD